MKTEFTGRVHACWSTHFCWKGHVAPCRERLV